MARKLIVEVVAAKALMPKDGQGSTNAYCVLDYDGQRKRTRVKPKDLDPVWNEKFEFTITDVAMPGDLEINIQNERNSGTGRRSSFLGKVTVPVSMVPNRPEAVRWFPLQKRGLFSHIKGDLGLRIWWQPTDSVTKSYEGDGVYSEGRVRQDPFEGGGVRPNKNVAMPDRQPDPRPNSVTVPENDFFVKETNPDLGKAVDHKQHFDLVEGMMYLFVRVVRARGLLGKDTTGLSDPYCKITVGPVKTVTRVFKRSLNPEWNEVFAVGRDKIQGGSLEVSVWDE